VETNQNSGKKIGKERGKIKEQSEKKPKFFKLQEISFENF